MHANMASATSASDSSWYPDTGSNVHLNNDLSNLNMHAEDYTGTNQIWVGNGQGLHILHSGHGILPTPSHNFHLFLLLHVPQIQKNLIFVNQFTRDNHVFIEFHPTFFCVKDLQTRQLLSSKAWVNSASIYGPPLMLLPPSLLLPSLVRKCPWINDIFSWVI
jgi:hypothetical protein